MKIVIGTNTYGKYHRQDVAVDSLRHLSTLHDIPIVNVQLREDKDVLPVHYDVDYMFELERCSKDLVPESTKRLPVMSDIMSVLSRMDCDYFVYVNSDVVLNNNLIKYIKTESPDSFASSRLDIEPLDSFQQVLDKNVTPIRYEIAGFDVFVFKKSWYVDNVNLFDDFLMGQPCWDQCYAMMFKLFGGGHVLGNVYPPYCFHVMHEPTWQVNQNTPECIHNYKLADNSLNKPVCEMFNKYISDTLVKRQPYGRFLYPLQNEREIEEEFFRVKS